MTALLRLQNFEDAKAVGRFIDKLIEDSRVIQTVEGLNGAASGQFLWKIVEGIVRCPSGRLVSLHDPDTFSYKTRMIEEAAQECRESSVCSPYCPLLDML